MKMKYRSPVEVDIFKKLTNKLKIKALKGFVSDTSYYEAVLTVKRDAEVDGVTVDEIAPLEEPFYALIDEVQLYLEDKWTEATNTVMLVVGLPKLALQSSINDVGTKLYKFLVELYKALQYESFRFYASTSVGVGVSAAVSAGVGFTLDINGSITLFYERKYMSNRAPVMYNNSLSESEQVIGILESGAFKNKFTDVRLPEKK